MTGAGLLSRSFWNLLATPPGFDVAGTLKAELQLPQSRYAIQNNPTPTSTAIEQFNATLIRRALAIPRVQSAAVAANHPLDGGFASSFVILHREAEAANWPEISIRRVTPGYFATLRIPLRRGRFIEDRGRASAPGGVVINQTVLDRIFPGVDPVGHEITFWGTAWTIVRTSGAQAGLMTNAELLQSLSVTTPAAIFPQRAPFGLAEGAPASFLASRSSAERYPFGRAENPVETG